MRKYTGSHPTAIQSIGGQVAPHLILVTTNNGGKYLIKDHCFPRLGQDVFDHNFIRCHTWTFEQDVTRFHRVVEGYALPFAEYVNRTVSIFARLPIEELERWARKAFTEDMAQQGVLVKFTA